jgi:hypothetical protein
MNGAPDGLGVVEENSKAKAKYRVRSTALLKMTRLWGGGGQATATADPYGMTTKRTGNNRDNGSGNGSLFVRLV